MNYKDLIKKLQFSEGEKSAKIMKELGQFLKKCSPGEKTTFSSECINAIPKANEKRKGSLSFLIALANTHKELIIDLLNDSNPIIREQTIKGLLHQGEKYLTILEKRLKDEKLYRIKKWILLTIGNIGTIKAIKIIEKTEVEPQIFSTKEKIIAKFQQEKKHNEKITGRGGTMIVQTVQGAEEEWLFAMSKQEGENITGIRFGNGIIQLDKEVSFDKFANCRSIFRYGIMLGKIEGLQTVLFKRFGQAQQYCIKFTNKIIGEKEKLSKFQLELSKNNWEYNSKAPLTLELLNEEEGMLLIKPYIKENLEYLPASINRVVASVVNLISENEHHYPNIILDPCCGAGTLLCENSKRLNSTNKKIKDEHMPRTAKYIGIDMDSNAIEKSRKNAKEYNIEIELQNKRFEEFLLVKPADLVLCNPPFDIRIKGDFDHEKLMGFIEKNTSENATIIIYTVKKYDLREACENNNLRIIKEIKLKLKKINPSVFIIRKTN